MRVAHFRQEFSTSSETFIYDYVSEMQRQGVDTRVVTLRRVNEESRPFPNVTVVERPSRWHPRRLWHRALVPFGERKPLHAEWPQIRDRLEEALREIQPDVIHAHFGPAGVIMAPVADRLGVPLAITLYGYDVSRLTREKFWREKYSSAFSKASLLIGISSHICSRIRELGGDSEKTFCCHLGVDLSQFKYRHADGSFDGKTVQCLHVGRLVEKKSPIDLVRAFKIALDETGGNIDLQLKIAGDGPLRADLRQEVRDLGIEGHVSLLGAVPHSRVVKLLAQANLYTQHCKTASNGDQEGQGVSFVEASASGLPIIATRHNGLPDVILDGETGYLVEEGDVKAMGRKIAHLAKKPEKWRRMGKAGRRHIEKKFDQKNQTERMKRIIKSNVQVYQK